MKPFKPLWWLKNPHAQTIWPTLFTRTLPPCRWQRLELADGDFQDLVWFGHGPKLIVILHGLEGNIRSHYVVDLLHQLDPKQYSTVFIHHRGCSGETNRLDRMYHSGETQDLNNIINHVTSLYQQPVHAVIGFSLGANMLLKWLGEQAHFAPTKCAIAVSVPFELAASGHRLQRGFSRFYQIYLLSRLKISYRKKFTSRAASPKINKNLDLSKINTFYDFDDRITAPLHGFKDAKEYYAQSSCRQFLPNIKIPTLIIHAKDDPFTVEHSIPNQSELPDEVRLELSQEGGHVGFVSGSYRPQPWLPSRIKAFIQDVDLN